jgi:quercetin dioxygenase-like cupin family protein
MSEVGTGWTIADMEQRCVRYADLRPCFNAFIDTRTPGSEAKENFTIIGPGVSESPDQHVHIPEPHGFNVGGARQPPGCVNSQHSHKTAEVFVVHSGKWRFDLGEHGEDGQLFLEEGDFLSIPTNIFRGFTNVGEGTGFLWVVLGGNDPGRVMWSPKVFEMARDYGLVLLKSGNLVDTRQGQQIPPGEEPMPPTSPRDVAAMTRVSQEDAEKLPWRSAERAARGQQNLIGENGFYRWPHGFEIDRIELEAGDVLPECSSKNPRVLFIQSGHARVIWSGGSIDLAAGDTFSVPRNLAHGVATAEGAVVFVVDGTTEA